MELWFNKTCCSRFRKTATLTDNADAERKRPETTCTHSIIDPIDTQYREPLMGSPSSAYGALLIN